MIPKEYFERVSTKIAAEEQKVHFACSQSAKEVLALVMGVRGAAGLGRPANKTCVLR